MQRLVAMLFVLVACGPGGKRNPDGGGGGDDAPPGCVEGEHQCNGNDFQTCTNGQLVTTSTCPNFCNPSLGCVLCQPGTGTCNGMTSTSCLPDGSGYYDEFCDPAMGSTCDTQTGVCTGPCASQTLGQSYIGCDYYATVTSQLVNPSFEFAVAISNTTMSPATVTIDGGALTAAITLTVMPNAVATQRLPWVPVLKTCNTQGLFECGAPQQYGALAVKGGYHIRSTQPVTVYQFSPLDYTAGGQFSYSNDASLLVPTTVWGKQFRVATWQTWVFSSSLIMPSVFAVTSTNDNTLVTITTRANTMGGNGAPNFTAGAAQTVTLNKGDVLQLMAPGGDLTGSLVTADKPVSVIGGHHCTQIPIGYTACDHIEELVFPIETLSNEYLVTSPFLGAGPRAEVVRIVATEAATMVTLDPATVGGPYMLANAGDFVEIAQRPENFQVKADKKIVVSQYMESQDAPGGSGIGDPAMAMAVPTAQYRNQYQFHAPTNYTNNYVNITAPVGADVLLDGVSVPSTAYSPIGTSGFGVARMPLANTGTGTHTATSTMPFGISVYGYGQYTSYWYPGGLDLSPIVIQ